VVLILVRWLCVLGVMMSCLVYDMGFLFGLVVMFVVCISVCRLIIVF